MMTKDKKSTPDQESTDNAELAVKEHAIREYRENHCGIPQKKLAERTGVPVAELRKLERNIVRTAKKSTLLKIADVLGVDLSQLVVPIAPAQQELFHAVGMAGYPSVKRSGVFQDYGKRGRNYPIRLEWADCFGLSRVSANVARDVKSDEKFLRVEFRNSKDHFPCNVSINPQDIAPRVIEGGACLRFSAILVHSGEPEENTGFCIRVSDSSCRQWVYMERVGYRNFDLGKPIDGVKFKEDKKRDTYIAEGLPDKADPSWTNVEMKISGVDVGEDEVVWDPFFQDQGLPDFSTITGVTIEFGRIERHQRPRGGSGVVVLSKMELTDE